ncbi:MAG: hypothetical protein LBT36_05110 [Oscillospiraceae bacterium]|jgi:hypothetical protein|nr:hypothetical protein [Oscillospiraceae bacterium]
MEKFVPYEKLSKRKRQQLDKQRRRVWGAMNPVTRRPQNPRAYDRGKTRQWKDDSSAAGSCFMPCRA